MRVVPPPPGCTRRGASGSGPRPVGPSMRSGGDPPTLPQHPVSRQRPGPAPRLALPACGSLSALPNRTSPTPPPGCTPRWPSASRPPSHKVRSGRTIAAFPHDDASPPLSKWPEHHERPGRPCGWLSGGRVLVGCSSPVKSRFSFRGNVELCPPADSPIGGLVIQAFDTWPAVCRLLA